MDFVLIQALNGLAGASALFLVAAGLSLIFGVSRVVNFAHGTVYMVGAYLAWSLAGTCGLGFWAAVPLSALACAVLGGLTEVLILRRLYGRHDLLPLLATFALVLIAHDLVPMIWGPQDIIGPRAPGLSGAVTILGRPFPAYDLFLIAVGPLVMAGLWVLVHLTAFGRLVRAATEDRVMAAALGIRQDLLFTGVFMLGCALAGLAGALQLPRETLHHSLDMEVIVSAFVVVVIGGLGSLTGAFAAALAVAEASAFGVVVWPEGTLATLFLAMAVVLVLRPRGLFGGKGADVPAPAPALAPPPPRRTWEAGLCLGALAALGAGFFASGFALDVATQVLVAALFALGLHVLVGWAGLISFGHAAFFGLGGYAAALLWTRIPGIPWVFALLGGGAVAGAGAALFGRLVRRMGGVYLAMLTLALSQVLYAAAFQWTSLTGGDNGLLGLWPPPPLDRPWVLFAAALAVALGAALAVISLYRSRFGYVLRAAEDSEARARALDLPVDAARTAAMALAGTPAGLGGALFVFLKGSAFPPLFDVSRSVDGLVMILLGGIAHPLGPLAGAAAYTLAVVALSLATPHWHVAVGIAILVLTRIFPAGLLGRGGKEDTP